MSLCAMLTLYADDHPALPTHLHDFSPSLNTVPSWLLSNYLTLNTSKLKYATGTPPFSALCLLFTYLVIL